MWLCVRVCVIMRVCVFLCMRERGYLCLCRCLCVYVRVCVRGYAQTYPLKEGMFVCVCVWIGVRVTCACVRDMRVHMPTRVCFIKAE